MEWRRLVALPIKADDSSALHALLTALGEENVVHLLKYLMSEGPVR